MKLWFRLTLVCCVLLRVFLSFPQLVGLSHGLQIVGSRPWFDRERSTASDAPAVSVVRRMRFDLPRAVPLACLLVDCAWAACNLGPPDSETHGPFETDRVLASCRSSSQAINPNQRLEHTLLHENYWLKTPILKNQGFTTAFS
jgi:hypothetical protein